MSFEDWMPKIGYILNEMVKIIIFILYNMYVFVYKECIL